GAALVRRLGVDRHRSQQDHGGQSEKPSHQDSWRHDFYRKSAIRQALSPGLVRPALFGSISLAVNKPWSVAANQGIALEARVRKLGIIEGKMQAAAFLSAQRRIDDQ